MDPKTGRLYVIEMNPRVFGSSALGRPSNGFPLGQDRRELAIGYTLDELQNDITGGQTRSFGLQLITL